MDVEAFVDSSAAPAQRVRFMRAMAAITAAIDCVDSQARVLSEAVPSLPADEVSAMLVLLWFARPNYAAHAQALAAQEPPVAPACNSKQSDAL